MDACLLLAISLPNFSAILMAALGLGLVIFFHELGHFAVAKWCGVLVERFSIGFGPILYQFKYGETDYALSLIPFGGYVKMLGQDDADPSQMTDTELQANPRSYTHKTVLQRMAIISAGVIMNIITGLLFFTLAFRMGVAVSPPEIGGTLIGQPAWQAGLKPGDKIETINGRQTSTFMDIVRASALSGGDPLQITGKTANGDAFEKSVQPVLKETRMQIGAEPARALKLPKFADNKPPVSSGSPAEKAGGFLGGDEIIAIDGVSIDSVSQLHEYLAEHRSQEVIYKIKSEEGQTKDIKVEPYPFRSLGFSPLMGRIEAIQIGSPAEIAELKVGDTIVKVNGKSVGTELNPLKLPGWFADHHDETVELTIQREEPGTSSKEMKIIVSPIKRGGWLEMPHDRNVPISIPAIGIAFHAMSTIAQVDPSGPAAGKLEPNERISKIEILSDELIDAKSREKSDRKELLLKENERNLGYALALLQQLAKSKVNLTVMNADGVERVVEIEPTADSEWFLPNRGVIINLLTIEQSGDNLAASAQMAFTHTKNSALEIYLTLSSLITQKLSIKELHGPFGIAKVAYLVAEQGVSDFLMFLGFLSINLAVLNFLPIPLLDGGHMVFLIWEGLTGRKPNANVQNVAQLIGLLFVVSLMLLVIYLDIFQHKLFSGGN